MPGFDFEKDTSDNEELIESNIVNNLKIKYV